MPGYSQDVKSPLPQCSDGARVLPFRTTWYGPNSGAPMSACGPSSMGTYVNMLIEVGNAASKVALTLSTRDRTGDLMGGLELPTRRIMLDAVTLTYTSLPVVSQEFGQSDTSPKNRSDRTKMLE